MVGHDTALGIEGNAEAQKRLRQYLEGGRIHPASILAGPRSSNKLGLTKNIAKFLLCPKRGPKGFCGHCSTCDRIERDTHPDVIVWTDASQDLIKIDTVRDLCHQMSLTPVEGEVRVCIIDECHRMNAAAANAFLKTLEEPGPGRFFWLLTSQMSSLLPTLLSRCLKFILKPEKELTAESPGVSPEIAKQVTDFLKTRSISDVVSQLDTKEEVLGFVTQLQTHLRQEVLSGKHFFNYSSLNQFDEALALEGSLRSNANYGLMLESFLIRNFS